MGMRQGDDNEISPHASKRSRDAPTVFRRCDFDAPIANLLGRADARCTDAREIQSGPPPPILILK